ncbi:MAG: VCBS repeat-containing protein [Bacteroidetes bacterium]|nr:VCBS repeat-containing protein [Bacteroidota bacterium]
MAFLFLLQTSFDMPHLNFKRSLYLLTCIFLTYACSRNTLFVEISSEYSGVNFSNTILETDDFNILTEEYIFNGGGVAVADFNLDGLPDLFFSGNQSPSALYLNEGNLQFTDVSQHSGINSERRWFTGTTVIDVNTDGLPDIYVSAGVDDQPEMRRNVLWVHQGLNENGVPIFINLADQYGLADAHSSMWSAVLDYDKDGLLDLYVLNNEQVGILPTNYREKVNDGSSPSNDRLYRNNGDGSFTDVTIGAGIIYEGYGLGVAVADINYDGYDDLYITNDYLSNDLLYVNTGQSSFKNEIPKRIKHQSKFSMGVDINDINNDGLLDIVSVDMLGETNQRMKTTVSGVNYISEVYNKRWGYEPQYMRNMLHVGNGTNLPFSEVGMFAGIEKTDWSWSPLMADMDNDGFRDILISNGFPRDVTDMDFSNYKLEFGQYASSRMILDSVPVVKIPNYAFKNNSNLAFEEISEAWGLNIPSFSNGAVYADLDLDGDLDYVVNNINDKAFIFENTASKKFKERNYIQLQLFGPPTNTLGIGAKVFIDYGDRKLYSEQRLGRGYMSSVDPVLHFGLGKGPEKVTLTIIWPDNRSQIIQNLEVNKRHIVNYDQSNQNSKPLGEYFLEESSKQPLLERNKEIVLSYYVHKEEDIIDFSAQHLLPYKISQNGPVLATGDFDGNGYEDLIIGSSSGYSPEVFLQNEFGDFDLYPLYSDERLWEHEEAAVVVFDIDNDGDEDLFMISGGGDYKAPKSVFNQILLINDGSGNFTHSTSLIPPLTFNASTAEAVDFNGDGLMDIFLGGGVVPGQYPRAHKSMLLQNTGERLVDVTETIFPDLANLGIVTDVKWQDMDRDGDPDLVIAGHYKPIEIFLNERGFFQRLTTSLDNKLGWFNTIEIDDFNNDGFPDIIAGNLGSNNLYKVSEERPLTLLAKDFDSNGSIDPVLFAYYKNEEGGYSNFPVAFWGDVSKQSPLFRGKFNFYSEYGKTDIESLFTEEELNGVMKYFMNFDRSVLMLNTGKLDFEVIDLPLEAQLGPINDLLVLDINQDGNLDIMAVGNNYGNEVFVGHLDALNGLVLLGDGSGDFKVVKTPQSGFNVPFDAKRLVRLKMGNGKDLFIASQNRDTLMVYTKN